MDYEVVVLHFFEVQNQNEVGVLLASPAIATVTVFAFCGVSPVPVLANHLY